MTEATPEEIESTLQEALRRLKVKHPTTTGRIQDGVLLFNHPIGKDEAVDCLFFDVNPLRPPRGCKFIWLEVKDDTQA